MGFQEAIKTCLTKYVDFSGRAARSEIWFFVLFLALGSIVATVINSILFGPEITQQLRLSIDGQGTQTQSLVQRQSYNGGWIGTAFSLFILLPLLSASVRRLHDRARSGWWLLIPVAVSAISMAIVYFTLVEAPVDMTGLPRSAAIPATISVPGNVSVFVTAWLISFVSFVVLIVWLARSSHPGPNKYGPNPNEAPQ